MRPRYLARGTTLLETLIAASVVSLMLIYGFKALIAGLRFQQRTRINLSLHESALNALSFFTKDLSESRSSSIVFSNRPNGVVFASAKDPNGVYQYDGSGNLLWWKAISYTVEDRDGSKRLFRRERDFSGPTPSIPIMGDVSDMIDDSLPTRIMGTDISTIQVSGTLPVEVTLVAAHSKMADKFSVTVKSRVVCLNDPPP